MIGLRVYPADRPQAALILAHGAGAGQASPFMVNAARGFASRGVTAATFDFPYMTARRRIPDPAHVLEQHWCDAIAEARNTLPNVPLFIGGKSMGGRIASHVAAQGRAGAIAGLVYLGYPLHPPGKPHQRRDAHLTSIGEPMLFVQGTRDAFGTAAEIRKLLPALPRATIYEVDGGDHSLKVPASAGTPEIVFDRVLDAAVDWMRRLRPGNFDR